jgi:hypothetical protein
MNDAEEQEAKRKIKTAEETSEHHKAESTHMYHFKKEEKNLFEEIMAEDGYVSSISPKNSTMINLKTPTQETSHVSSRKSQKKKDY